MRLENDRRGGGYLIGITVEFDGDGRRWQSFWNKAEVRGRGDDYDCTDYNDTGQCWSTADDVVRGEHWTLS